jgi:ABC-type uncharacterized transport system involved in gliding motility auxiliary subunit
MKNLSKIAGGIGLLLVLTSVITLLFTSGSLLVFGVKLGLGAALVALWALTHADRLSTWARSVFFYSSSLAMGLALLALLAGTNFIVARRGKTWDLTSKHIYSLSAQTETTLRELKEPVKVIAFVEGGTPEGAEALFQRYQQLSERFSYEFKDPRRSPDLTLKYQVHQGQPTAVLIRQGAVESHQQLNLARLSSAQLGEQELTQGLVKLNTVGAQRLYFLQGHGEWPLEPSGPGEDAERGALQVKRVLEDEGYAPEELNLVEKLAIPADASALVVAGARSRYSEQEKKLLGHYLDQGGRLLYFAEPGAESGLEPLLARYGFQLEPGLVADSRVSPDQPYLIITPFFGDHEITRLLAKARANVVFATTRAITVLREGLLPGVTDTPLVLTSPYAWIESTLAQDPQPDPGEKQGQLTLAALATRATEAAPDKRTDEARLLVFGDTELLAEAFGYDPNRNLVLNSLAWATQQAQKITIRPPDRDVSTVDLTPEAVSTIRLLSMDLFPTLLMGVGLTLWLTRRGR